MFVRTVWLHLRFFCCRCFRLFPGEVIVTVIRKKQLIVQQYVLFDANDPPVADVILLDAFAAKSGATFVK